MHRNLPWVRVHRDLPSLEVKMPLYTHLLLCLKSQHLLLPTRPGWSPSNLALVRPSLRPSEHQEM
jgi:hypothetical protein